MMLRFYDKTGTPLAYSVDGVHILTFAGRPLAYLSADVLFSYSHDRVGWLVDGWIVDDKGDCVLFTDHPRGGPPFRPIHSIAPIPNLVDFATRRKLESAKLAKPDSSTHELRPKVSSHWSALAPKDLFGAL